MYTTKISVDVPDNIYKILSTEQEKIKESTSKKTSLAAIMLDFCKIGIKSLPILQTDGNEQNSNRDLNSSAQHLSDTAQNNFNFEREINRSAQNDSDKTIKITKNRYIFEQKDELEAMFESLSEREYTLNDRMVMLEQQLENFYSKRNAFLNEKEASLYISVKLHELENQLSNKNDTIKELKKENYQLQLLQNQFKTVIENLENLEKKYRHVTLEKSLRDKIVPYLPIVAVALVTWLMSSGKSVFTKEKISELLDLLPENVRAIWKEKFKM